MSERKYIKHLQNKNVEVISDYAEVVKENINLRKQINQLQAENEKLKEQIRYYKKFLDPYRDKDYGNYTLEEK